MMEEQNLEQSIRETFSDIIEAGENILIQELIRTGEAAYSMWTYKTDKLRTKVLFKYYVCNRYILYRADDSFVFNIRGSASSEVVVEITTNSNEVVSDSMGNVYY